MRAHFFQHVPFEGLGSIENWLTTAGYEITSTRFYETQKLPDLDKIDVLIVMGGPMSVNDEAQFPWLITEKKYIRDTIDSGKSVLGICLGAQLIASAMGASVYVNSEKEIGWYPIWGTPRKNNSQFSFPSKLLVFHWHGETFDLPENAVRLAKSEGCENQAFQLGQSVIGLQFHLETTSESANEIVSNCQNELVPSNYIQSREEILSVEPENYKSINRIMDEILSYLVVNSAGSVPAELKRAPKFL